jgi:hypothetical protein
MSDIKLVKLSLKIDNNIVPITSAEDDFYLNVKDKVVIFRSTPDTYYNIVKLDNIEIEKINSDYVERNYPNIQLTTIKKLSYRYATPEEIEKINSIIEAAIKNGTVYD